MSIRVLLADDHPLLRTGIRTALENEKDIDIVGETADTYNVRLMTQALKPDVLLLDMVMPGPTPYETVSFIREKCPQIKIVVLTATNDKAMIRLMMKAGVSAYLLKEEPNITIVEAIRTVFKGGSWFSQAVLAKIQQQTNKSGSSADDSLTARELEVIALIAHGLSNKKIAQKLQIAEPTVAFHVSNILQKLEVSSRVEAALWASSQGIV